MKVNMRGRHVIVRGNFEINNTLKRNAHASLYGPFYYTVYF